MKKANAQRVAALPAHAQVQVEAIEDLIKHNDDAIDLYEAGLRALLPSDDGKPFLPFTIYPETPDPTEVELWAKEDRPRLSTFYGSHTLLCGDSEAERGQPLGDHGPWCESVSLGNVSGWNDEGRRIEVGASVVDRYMHGVYADYRDRVGRSDRFIAIRMGEHPGEVVTYLSVGEALRLVAGINALAAAADNLDILNRKTSA